MDNFSHRLLAIHHREKASDVFYTPVDLVQDLLKKVPIEEGDSLLDPFAGLGVWFDNFPSSCTNSWSEISRGVDFWSITERYDWLISNPPFSQLTDIFIRSCYLSKKGFAYIMPLNALSFSRLDKISNHGFSITSFTLFRNPKEWNIGFPMCFIVWEKNPSVESIFTLRSPNILQSNLSDFLQ